MSKSISEILIHPPARPWLRFSCLKLYSEIVFLCEKWLFYWKAHPEFCSHSSENCSCRFWSFKPLGHTSVLLILIKINRDEKCVSSFLLKWVEVWSHEVPFMCWNVCVSHVWQSVYTFLSIRYPHLFALKWTVWTVQYLCVLRFHNLLFCVYFTVLTYSRLLPHAYKNPTPFSLSTSYYLM